MMNVFIFAHQDDEFGVFYEIKKLISHGEKIIIIYLTSGTLDGSVSNVRNTESLFVLSRLGVKASNVYFLGAEAGIPDGSLSHHIEKAFDITLNVIQKNGELSRIYTLAWEGGHQDHDAAHLVSLAIAKKMDVVNNSYQFPLYTGLNTFWVIFRLFVVNDLNGRADISKIPLRDRGTFLRFIFYYKSQLKTWLALMPFLFLHYVFYGTQVLQVISLDRSQNAPHEGILLYERRGFYTYEKFLADVRSFIKTYI